MILVVSLFTSCGFGGEAEFKSTRTSCEDGTVRKCSGSGDAKAKTADPASTENPITTKSSKTESEEKGESTNVENVDPSEGGEVEQETPVEEEPAPVILLTTFEGDTKAVWKKCADVCHSATGSNRQERPYLDVYAEAKANAKNKTGGHKGVSLNNDEKDLVLKWVADGSPEK